MNTLSNYQSKRNFNLTNEPRGKKQSKKNSHLTFVVQFHRASRDHYDFRLEWKGVLLSWAVPKGPSFNPSDKRLAVKVEDHPLEYAQFEGNIPHGEYGGGTVMIFDYGTWKPNKDFTEGLKKGVLKFSLFGERLCGSWTLIRLNDEDNSNNWLLIKEKDDKAKKSAGISSFKTSIKSGKTLSAIAKDVKDKKNPFSNIDVQLAKLSTEIPQDDSWLYEIKFDGYRIVTFVENDEVKLVTRNNNDYTHKMTHLAATMREFFVGRSVVLDGEVICQNEKGQSDFQALQRSLKYSKDNSLTYAVFDILALDGVDLRDEPLLERKRILSELLKDAPVSLIVSQFEIGNGEQVFNAAKKLGLEGIVGKRIDSIYKSGRSNDWIKIKCRKRQEFVIGGYIVSKVRNSGIKALLLGYYEEKRLIYIGLAGTGFSGLVGKELIKKFKSLQRKSSPFAESISTTEPVVFLKPILIGEIEYAEFTREGHLRQASFKGLREDKSATEVVNEEKYNKTNDKSDDMKKVVFEGINVTNPRRLIYEDKEITKLDVIKYYSSVSERMLPYLSNRLLSVMRCHKGIKSSCFYKKHPDSLHDGIDVKRIKSKEGGTGDYFYIKNKKGLLGEVQLGSVEFHPWGSEVTNLESPNMMVFDLDPDEGIDLKQVRKGAKDLKKVLDELDLVSFVKTSGGKGYHIVVPFKKTCDWSAFRDFARDVAKYMENKWPHLYTSNVRKNNRDGKIFIDWMRNGKGATSVAPYSLRSRPGAKVSMPISWRELNRIAPDGIDLNDAIKRLKRADPWKEYFTIKQRLSKKLSK